MARYVSWLEIPIIAGVENLREYLRTMASCLTEELERFNAWIDHEAEKITDEEERERFFDFYQDDHWRRSDVFPNMMHSSLFVSTYSFFEHQMMSVCDHVQRRRGFAVSVKDVQGRGYIGQVQTYLKKVAEIEFPDGSQEWQAIKNFQTIRNAIVHRDGELNQDAAVTLKSFLESNHAKLDEYNRVHLTTEFCKAFIDAVEAFFMLLLKSKGVA